MPIAEMIFCFFICYSGPFCTRNIRRFSRNFDHAAMKRNLNSLKENPHKENCWCYLRNLRRKRLLERAAPPIALEQKKRHEIPMRLYSSLLLSLADVSIVGFLDV